MSYRYKTYVFKLSTGCFQANQPPTNQRKVQWLINIQSIDFCEDDHKSVITHVIRDKSNTTTNFQKIKKKNRGGGHGEEEKEREEHHRLNFGFCIHIIFF